MAANKRTRFTDDERLYLMSLVEADNNLDNSSKSNLVGKPIRDLLRKLGSTETQEAKIRYVVNKPTSCLLCERVLKSPAGLARHLATKHSVLSEGVSNE